MESEEGAAAESAPTKRGGDTPFDEAVDCATGDTSASTMPCQALCAQKGTRCMRDFDYELRLLDLMRLIPDTTLAFTRMRKDKTSTCQQDNSFPEILSCFLCRTHRRALVDTGSLSFVTNVVGILDQPETICGAVYNITVPNSARLKADGQIASQVFQDAGVDTRIQVGSAEARATVQKALAAIPDGKPRTDCELQPIKPVTPASGAGGAASPVVHRCNAWVGCSRSGQITQCPLIATHFYRFSGSVPLNRESVVCGVQSKMADLAGKSDSEAQKQFEGFDGMAKLDCVYICPHHFSQILSGGSIKLKIAYAEVKDATGAVKRVPLTWLQGAQVGGALLSFFNPPVGAALNGALSMYNLYKAYKSRSAVASGLALVSLGCCIFSLVPTLGACEMSSMPAGPFDVYHCERVLSFFRDDTGLTTTHFTLR